MVAESSRQTVRWEDDLCPTDETGLVHSRLTINDQDGKTYAAFQGATIDIETTQLTDGHGGILMGIHLDKGKAAIGLEARFDNITIVLEEWDQVVLGGVRREIANVAGSLPLRCLLHNHIVALNTMGREMMVAEWGGRRHPHS